MEWDTLVSALSQHGIRFLTYEGGPREVKLTPDELIRELALHPHPRLHLALTSLFLLHPEYHESVPRVLSELEGAAAIELQARYMAAVFLQRMWKTRLSYYVENQSPLPDYFSDELGLPPADERFGKTGLYALAEWHAERSDYPYNRLGSYSKAAELLFGQERAEARHRELAIAG